MDRETANRLADELIAKEQATPEREQITFKTESRTANDGPSVRHFALPVVVAALSTWAALAAEASGGFAIFLGVGIGLTVSHFVVKHLQ